MVELKLVSIHIQASPQAMGLATAMLKARLMAREGFCDKMEVSLCDFYLGESASELAQKLVTEQSAYIGFSVYVWNQHLVNEISREIKKINPLITIFAGGAQASSAPQELFSGGEFDFIICGEAEEVLPEAIEHLWAGESLEGMAGVALADQKEPPAPGAVSANLDDLPSPWLSGVVDLTARKGVLWELSRGCVFDCSFCYEGRGTRGVRYYSLERLRAELELFEKEKVEQIFVLDATFNQRRPRAKEILRMIQEVAPQIHYTFEVRTEFLDYEMVELFSSLHCTLQIGLQSAHREVCALLCRKFDAGKYSAKIAMLNEAGVSFGLDLIYGLPEDTFAGFCESLDYALTLQPNNLDIFPLALLPQTELYDRAEQYRLNALKEAPYTVISTPGFSAEEMKHSAKLSYAVDLFYNRGRASGWFFMVTETIGWPPSVFLRRFAGFDEFPGEGAVSSQDEILSLQLSFCEKIFQETGHASLFGPMRDIILFHHAFGESLFAGSSLPQEATFGARDSQDKIEPGKGSLRPKLCPHVFFVSLQYDLDELMMIGEYNLKEFLKNFDPFPAEVMVYNRQGEIKAQAIDLNWSKLLKQCDGNRSVTELIGAGKREISEKSKELYTILDFAFHEGIIFPE